MPVTESVCHLPELCSDKAINRHPHILCDFFLTFIETVLCLAVSVHSMFIDIHNIKHYKNIMVTKLKVLCIKKKKPKNLSQVHDTLGDLY